MNEIAETLGAVYIYIYIVGFNKIKLCKRSKAMYFNEPKIHLDTQLFFYAKNYERIKKWEIVKKKEKKQKKEKKEIA